jgi:PAS domain S-box-containing protein
MPDNRKEYAKLQKKIKSLRRRIAELEKDELRHSRMVAPPKSDLLYHTLMENLHLGVSFIDTNYRVVTTNGGMGMFLGRPRNEIIGKYCFKEFEKRKAICPHCPGRRAMATGRPAEVETEGVRDDGSRAAVHVRAFPILETDGSAKGFLEIAEDITERKQAEEKLQESEERYREMVEETPDVIYTLDTKGNVTSVNKAGKAMFGRERKEVIGRHFTEWIPKEEQPAAVTAFKRILGGEKITTETILIDKHGKPHNIEFSSTPIMKAGKAVGTRGIIRDITERKQAEEKLKESEQRFKTIFDNAPDGILLTNVENKKFYISNKAICKMLGYKPEEIKNLAVSDIHPKEHLSYVIEQFEKQARKEITVAEDIPVKRKDGSVFYADIGSFPIVLDGKIYLAGIFRDVTERKKMEEELNIYREKMARAEQLASLGTLSATLAHELTQPLTVIRLSIENALEDLDAASCPKTVLKGLREGLNEVANATSVVERFRNFARQSSRKTLCKINVSAIADRIVLLLGKAAQRAKIRLCLKGMNKLPAIHSNEKDVEQLFFALIENAIQAAGGKKNYRLTIEGVVKGKNIELRFADNCCGIAPENLNKIFDPFFTTGSNDGRTGLGLPIVQRIVSGFGGKIHVWSRLGKGTLFYITLPIYPPGPIRSRFAGEAS